MRWHIAFGLQVCLWSVDAGNRHEYDRSAEHQPREEPEEGRAGEAKLATDLCVATQHDLTGTGRFQIELQFGTAPCQP